MLARTCVCALSLVLLAFALPLAVMGSLAMKTVRAQQLTERGTFTRAAALALLITGGLVLVTGLAACRAACSRASRGCSRAVALSGTCAAFLLACAASVLSGPTSELLLQLPLNTSLFNESLVVASVTADSAGAYVRASFDAVYSSCDPVAYRTDGVNRACQQLAPAGDDLCTHNTPARIGLYCTAGPSVALPIRLDTALYHPPATARALLTAGAAPGAGAAPLASPPPVPPPVSPTVGRGPCESWCYASSTDWEFNCASFSACVGCDECFVAPPPLAPPPPAAPIESPPPAAPTPPAGEDVVTLALAARDLGWWVSTLCMPSVQAYDAAAAASAAQSPEPATRQVAACLAAEAHRTPSDPWSAVLTQAGLSADQRAVLDALQGETLAGMDAGAAWCWCDAAGREAAQRAGDWTSWSAPLAAAGLLLAMLAQCALMCSARGRKEPPLCSWLFCEADEEEAEDSQLLRGPASDGRASPDKGGARHRMRALQAMILPEGKKAWVKPLQKEVNSPWDEACALIAAVGATYSQVLLEARAILPEPPELRPLVEDAVAAARTAAMADLPDALCLEQWPRVPEEAMWQELGSSDFEATPWRAVSAALRPHLQAARELLALVQVCGAQGFYGSLSPRHGAYTLQRTRDLADMVRPPRVAPQRSAAALRALLAWSDAADVVMSPSSSNQAAAEDEGMRMLRRLRLGAVSMLHGVAIELKPPRLKPDERQPHRVLISGPTSLLHRLAACDARWYDEDADGFPALLSPLSPLRLSGDERRRAGVPMGARHVAYLHPLPQREPLSAEQVAALLERAPSDGFALCGALVYFDGSGKQMRASGSCALSPGGECKLLGPFAMSASAQATVAEQQRWQPVALEALTEAGALSSAWLHPSEGWLTGRHGWELGLGEQPVPYGGLAFSSEALGDGAAVYFAFEPPAGKARLRLEASAPLGRPATLRDSLALPTLGSSRLVDTTATSIAPAAPRVAAGGAWRDVKLVLEVPVSHSVRDLKLRIAREWHLPVDAQHLTLPARRSPSALADDESLAEIGCKEGSQHALRLHLS